VADDLAPQISELLRRCEAGWSCLSTGLRDLCGSASRASRSGGTRRRGDPLVAHDERPSEPVSPRSAHALRGRLEYCSATTVDVSSAVREVELPVSSQIAEARRVLCELPCLPRLSGGWGCVSRVGRAVRVGTSARGPAKLRPRVHRKWARDAPAGCARPRRPGARAGDSRARDDRPCAR
jgi:hypothetical protein